MPSTRSLSPARSRLLIAIALGLTIWAILVGSTLATADPNHDPQNTDLNLYQAIAERVAAGQSYYDAAVVEQVNRGGPAAPAATVRLPTTTYVNVIFGPSGTQWLLYGLTAIVVAVALVRFERVSRNKAEWLGATLLLILALLVPLSPGGTYFSEVWAALLTLLAVLFGPRRRPTLSLSLVVVALLFRELVVLFAAAMALWLWTTNQRRIALAWALVIATFTIGYIALHTGMVDQAVETNVTGAVPHSPGWVRFGGWPLVVDYFRRMTVLQFLPFWVSAVALALALVGLGMRRSTLTTAMLVGAAGYLTAFMIIGRPANAYWGTLYVALVLPGLAFAGSGILAVLRSAATSPSE